MSRIVVDATSNGGFNSGGSSVTHSHTIGSKSNRYLLVNIGAYKNSTDATNLVVTGVTYNGVALTNIPGASTTFTDGGGKKHRQEAWYLPSNLMPAAGSYNIVVTFTGAIDKASVTAISYFYVKPAAPEAVGTPVTGTGSIGVNFSVTTVTPYAFAVGLYYEKAGAGAQGVGSGETLDIKDTTYDGKTAISHEEQAVPGSVSMSFSDAFGTDCVAVGLSLAYQSTGKGFFIA